MEKISRIEGIAAPLMLNNVDTDVIIRIERLASTPKDQLGPYAFEALHYRADGSEEPGFILNQTAFRNAPILLCGENFGCGSSREGAVNALMGMGIRCVIAESFGDIFFNNCFQNGLLPIRLTSGEMASLRSACIDGARFLIDLPDQSITSSQGHKLSFEIEPFRRDALLHGIDEITQSLLQEPLIANWQLQDRIRRPWVWATVDRRAAVDQ